VAKLADMGLVKDVDNDLNLTKTGRGLGTPHYMAPEQFRNAKTVDIRGDVYSLGATLYALVTGRVPFENSNPLDCWMKKIRNEFPTPKELNPGLSERVDWAIRRSMSAEPAQRPTSCREFLEDLTGQSRPSHTPSSTAPPPGRSDVWYMVYKDETGQTHTVKGATEGIRNALKDCLLGDATSILVRAFEDGSVRSDRECPRVPGFDRESRADRAGGEANTRSNRPTLRALCPAGPRANAGKLARIACGNDGLRLRGSDAATRLRRRRAAP